MSTPHNAALLVAAWSGALLGTLVPGIGPMAAWALGMAGLVALVTAVLLRRHTVPPAVGAAWRSRWLLAIAASAVLLSTCGGAAVRVDAVQRGPLASMCREGSRSVHLIVQLTGDVADGDRRWATARLAQVDVASPPQPAVSSRERVLLRIPDEQRAPVVGGRYAIVGTASRLTGDAAAAFARRGVVVGVTVRSVELVGAPPPWHRLANGLRERVRTAAHDRLDPAEASLLTGLVTGDLSGQPEEVEAQVRASGLSHLVAVSGSNVALVVAVTVGVVGVLGGRRRLAWWTSVGAVWWFVVLVRAEPSVVRAAIMATLVLVAMLVGRLRSAPQLLCTAGLLALLVDPMLATSLGFSLSMAATAGVIVGMSPIHRVLRGRLHLPGPLSTIVAATCGAQLAVAPILLIAGGDVHPASLPANVMAVPAAGVASAVGGVAAVLAVLVPDVAGRVAVLARPALGVVLGSARTFSSTSAQRGTLIVLGVLAVASVLVGTARAWSDRSIAAWVPAVAVMVVGLVVVGAAVVGVGSSAGGASPDGPVLIALDVGQGDALLLGDPTAGWMLVDGGPDAEVLLARLRDRRIDRLAAVVITHPHEDHAAGIVGLLEAVDIGAVDIGTVIVGPHGVEAEGLEAAARSAGVPVVPVSDGMAWAHGVIDLAVLSPPSVGLGEEANENSLVLRAEVSGGMSALLTGDAEVIAQTLLLRDLAALDVDVVKVPHHGGDTNAPGFLVATTPEVAVISVGEGNPFGHPHPDVLADLVGVDVRRTDEEGDVVVPMSGGS